MPVSIFDTHCHYNLSSLYEDWQTHWEKAQKHGVAGAVVVGTTIETSKRAIEINQAEPRLLPAVGIHPNKYDETPPEDLPTTLHAEQSVLSMLIRNNPVAAIGETGLDYFRLEDATRDQTIYSQQQAFRMHIALANEHKLPLILHVRDKGEQAYTDVLDLLKKEYQFKRPFVLHCISGTPTYIKEALEMGAYVGVAGNVTYPSAEAIRELIKLVPPERLLSETDAPFLPPQSHRGKTCEPWMISETVQYLHDTLGISATIEQNAQALFSPSSSSN